MGVRMEIMQSLRLLTAGIGNSGWFQASRRARRGTSKPNNSSNGVRMVTWTVCAAIEAFSLTMKLPCLQGLFRSTIRGNFNFPTFPFKYYELTLMHVMNALNHHMCQKIPQIIYNRKAPFKAVQ